MRVCKKDERWRDGLVPVETGRTERRNDCPLRTGMETDEGTWDAGLTSLGGGVASPSSITRTRTLGAWPRANTVAPLARMPYW